MTDDVECVLCSLPVDVCRIHKQVKPHFPKVASVEVEAE